MADGTAFIVREVRAYATKQRPNRVTIHGPFVERRDALLFATDMNRKCSRNDNRSNFYVEPAPASQQGAA